MKHIRWGRLLMAMLWLFSSMLFSEENKNNSSFVPTDALYANWVFTGVVTNELGERYSYFFEMQRHESQFHAIAALFDGENKRVILLDESDAVLTDPKSYNWQVGRAFLRFNPINDSWIFGLKTKDNKGFNFKVDMLSEPKKAPMPQDLRKGVELLISQTNHLNGHLQAGLETKEQFVTSKNAWFRQVWLSSEQDKNHVFSGVLCRFHDGSGFYSVNLRELDALRGAVAGSCDAEGMSIVMSQFISVEQGSDGNWHIRVSSPKHHLVLSDAIKQNSVVAGFVVEGKNNGFCLLSEDVLGKQLLS